MSEEKGNVVFSPLSVHLAMAMVHAGAKGETAKELSKALCLPTDMDLEMLNRGFNEIINKFNVN